jgi:hypothetical protein
MVPGTCIIFSANFAGNSYSLTAARVVPISAAGVSAPALSPLPGGTGSAFPVGQSGPRRKNARLSGLAGKTQAEAGPGRLRFLRPKIAAVVQDRLPRERQAQTETVLSL